MADAGSIQKLQQERLVEILHKAGLPTFPGNITGRAFSLTRSLKGSEHFHPLKEQADYGTVLGVHMTWDQVQECWDIALTLSIRISGLNPIGPTDYLEFDQDGKVKTLTSNRGRYEFSFKLI